MLGNAPPAKPVRIVSLDVGFRARTFGVFAYPWALEMLGPNQIWIEVAMFRSLKALLTAYTALRKGE